MLLSIVKSNSFCVSEVRRNRYIFTGSQLRKRPEALGKNAVKRKVF